MTKEDTAALERALIAQVRAEIAAASLSQGSIADTIGIERATLSRYMSGKRALPLQVLLDICDTLNIPAGDLMRMAEERARRDTQRGGDTE